MYMYVCLLGGGKGDLDIHIGCCMGELERAGENKWLAIELYQFQTAVLLMPPYSWYVSH